MSELVGPERFLETGLFVHKMERVLPGDIVGAMRFVKRLVPKGTRHVVSELIVSPRGGSDKGSIKRIELLGYPGEEFNPKRFRKVGGDARLDVARLVRYGHFLVAEHYPSPDPELRAGLLCLMKNSRVFQVDSGFVTRKGDTLTWNDYEGRSWVMPS